MRTLRLGGRLPVSCIAYGCAQLGRSMHDTACVADETVTQAATAVRTALDAGITCFDHADIYGAGKAEAAFARALADIGARRQELVLQTKVGVRRAGDPQPGSPARYDFSYEHLIASAESSLRRLGTEYIDVYLLHRPDALVEPAEVARAFDALHRTGKVRWFGTSNHTWAQLALLQRHVDQPLLVNQVQVSLAHPQLIDAGVTAHADVPVRDADVTLDWCRSAGITIQAWRPLAKGRAIGDAADPRWHALHAVVQRLAQAHGVTPEAIAIAWLLRHPAGIQPVIGTSDPQRIQAIARAAAITLDRDAWYALFTAARGGKVP